MPVRPEKLVLVIGTATDIGKTWVGARTIECLRASGTEVAARKLAQSFDDPSGLAETDATDAEVLAAASGESADEVCPAHRSYPIAMAPPMAAEALGLTPPTLAELVEEITWPPSAPGSPAIGWVEAVGGPRSPIAIDGDSVDLAHRLDPDVIVLVADAGLGTINAVLLSLAPFSSGSTSSTRTITVLNRFSAADDLHRRNLEWLQTRKGLEVVTDPEALAAQLSR